MIERDEVRFDIELSHSDVEVAWFKNGAKLAPSKNFTFGVDEKQHWMIIRSAALDDDRAEISAHAEEERSTSMLYVEGRPQLLSLLPSGTNLLCSYLSTLFHHVESMLVSLRDNGTTL